MLKSCCCESQALSTLHAAEVSFDSEELAGSALEIDVRTWKSVDGYSRQVLLVPFDRSPLDESDSLHLALRLIAKRKTPWDQKRGRGDFTSPQFLWTHF